MLNGTFYSRSWDNDKKKKKWRTEHEEITDRKQAPNHQIKSRVPDCCVSYLSRGQGRWWPDVYGRPFCTQLFPAIFSLIPRRVQRGRYYCHCSQVEKLRLKPSSYLLNNKRYSIIEMSVNFESLHQAQVLWMPPYTQCAFCCWKTTIK